MERTKESVDALDDPPRTAMAKESLSALAVLRELTEAASRFVDRAPRQKRVEADRQALLDVITRAQLVLSVGGHQADKPKQSEVREAQVLLNSVPGKDAPTRPRLRKPPLRERRTRKPNKS